jgi:hypothetical protein
MAATVCRSSTTCLASTTAMAADDPIRPSPEDIFLQRTALTLIVLTGRDEMRRNTLDNRLASGRLSRRFLKSFT